MNSTRRVASGALLLVLLFGASTVAVFGGVVCIPNDIPDLDCLYILIGGITEESDPISMTLDEVRGVGSRSAVSREGTGAGSRSADVQGGAAYEDIEPQVATGGGITVAVWADTESGSGDIIFSEWRPGGWRQTYLTVGGTDERDPRVDVADDGTVWVAWWERDEPRQIRVVRRDPVTLTWGMPPAFDGLLGSRPAVIVVEDEVLVGYERRVWNGGQEVVVHRVDENGASTEMVLARTSREAPLLVELHTAARAYIDWVHTDGYFGYSEYADGRWGVDLTTRPLTQRAHPERREVEPLAP